MIPEYSDACDNLSQNENRISSLLSGLTAGISDLKNHCSCVRNKGYTFIVNTSAMDIIILAHVKSLSDLDYIIPAIKTRHRICMKHL